MTPQDGQITGGDASPDPTIVERIWARDPRLWGPGDDDPRDRLGWLDLPSTMEDHLPRLASFASSVAGSGTRTVALIGMGGSSLGPEVLARILGPSPGHPELMILDSTHPAEIRGYLQRLDLERTLFIVSSKSGGTIETMSLYGLFRDRAPGADFVAITDPGTSLEEMGRVERFREVFLNPPDVGGRFSALSLFGLVPAAAIGVDVEGLLRAARGAAADCREASRANEALAIGTALGRLAQGGRDKLTFLQSGGLDSFGDWVEQLIAESTGKHGEGIAPIVGEPIVDPAAYGPDRVFVDLREPGDATHDSFVAGLREAGQPVIRARAPVGTEIGAAFFDWEFITAVASSILGVNAFDQPDVESAKRAAKAVLGSDGREEWGDEDPGAVFADARPGDLAALLIFAPRTSETMHALSRARALLAARGLATSTGFGPRYLHSTGQLHKGGPPRVRALVVLGPPDEDLQVPGEEHTFGRLVTAQAEGDATALRASGRDVAQTTLGTFMGWIG